MHFLTYFATTAQVIPVLALAAFLEYKSLAAGLSSDGKLRTGFQRFMILLGVCLTLVWVFLGEFFSLVNLLGLDWGDSGYPDTWEANANIQTGVIVSLGGVVAMSVLLGFMTLKGISDHFSRQATERKAMERKARTTEQMRKIIRPSTVDSLRNVTTAAPNSNHGSAGTAPAVSQDRKRHRHRAEQPSPE